MKWAVYAAFGGLSCVGCLGAGAGGSEIGKPIARFPSQAELNQVASNPTGTPQGASDRADVDSWQMQAPASASQYPSDTAWDQLVLSSNQAQGNRVTLSTALRCAAEEVARFYTVNGGMPDDGLREHLLLRCGSTTVGHSFVYLTANVSDSTPDAQLESSGREGVQKLLNQGLSHGGLFGLASARGHGRYAVVAFSALERASLAPFSPVISGENVSLSGELKVPAAHVVALATHGPYGVSRCEIDPLARLPKFHVTCPVAAEDASARIEIVTKEDGRVLLEPVSELEVRRDDRAELEYKAGAYGANKPVANSAQFREQLLADLNQVRSAAGLQPFALESLQSQTDERLAPALYQTLGSGDVQQQTTITLGLLAGWDVRGGLIRDGGIFASSVNTI